MKKRNVLIKDKNNNKKKKGERKGTKGKRGLKRKDMKRRK
jgi:hypothetical protein